LHISQLNFDVHLYAKYPEKNVTEQSSKVIDLVSSVSCTFNFLGDEMEGNEEID